MKKLLIVGLIIEVFMLSSVFAKTIKVDIYGMTCSSCAYSLNKTFKSMKGVKNANVSLKNKNAILEITDNGPTIKKIKKAILDTGFTPTKITVLSR